MTYAIFSMTTKEILGLFTGILAFNDFSGWREPFYWLKKSQAGSSINYN